jgi:predicted DNA-binding transcriptional regulator AlpA
MPSPLESFDTLPNSAFIRLSTVTALFACSASTIWRGVKAGRLPRPIKHFDRASAWNVGQIRAVLQEKLVSK